MKENEKVSDTVLNNLSGGIDQPADNDRLKISKNPHRDSGKQIPGGNEDIFNPQLLKN